MQHKKIEQRAAFSADLKLGNLRLDSTVNLLYFCERKKIFGCYSFQKIRPMHQLVPREMMLVTYSSGPYGIVTFDLLMFSRPKIKWC